MVDQRRRLDQPRVGSPSALVVAPFGTHHAGFLLRPAHVQHCLGSIVLGQVRLGDVVLALVLGEVHQVQPVRFDEPADRGDECLGHRAINAEDAKV